MQISIVKVDYQNPTHSKDLLHVLEGYATDIMGGATPLSDHTKSNLIPTLAELPNVFSLLAYDGIEPVGLSNCIESFSTFACRKIINIHDFAVQPSHRGKGISQKLLAEIETIAKEMDCAKITLEVLEGNTTARNAYQKFGFCSYELDPSAGKALFLEKKI